MRSSGRAVALQSARFVAAVAELGPLAGQLRALLAGELNIMKRKRDVCLLGIAAILLYTASYIAYRVLGPTQKHWSVWSEFPVVLVRGESAMEDALYEVFRPC